MGAQADKRDVGVRQVDSAGRRWYTKSFKEAIVAACTQPDASVSRIAVDAGLNPNLVRKWLARARQEDAPLELLPVVAVPEPRTEDTPPWRHVVEVQIGEAVILIGEHARAELVRAIVQSLR